MRAMDVEASPRATAEEEDGEEVEDWLDQVVKVFVAVCEPNYGVPWAVKVQDSRTGSAFPISWEAGPGVRWLLTNAHVVQHAAVVQVRKRGDHRKHTAKVLCVGHECDLALLSVESDAFWANLPPLLLQPRLPSLNDEVCVVGYPVGGDNVSVTQGVVSRIDIMEYSSCGRKSLLAIQIDAAINPGNSGGPAFSTADFSCVGVAFQALVGDTENIGYIIPLEVVLHFLQDYHRHAAYTGFGHADFDTQELENEHLRRSLGLGEEQSGALVRRVHPATPAAACLHPNDVILAIEGQHVGNDAKVAFQSRERIGMDYPFTRMFPSDKCTLQVLRQTPEGPQEVGVGLELGRLRPLVPMDPPQPPQYLVCAGLVLVPLTEPYLRHQYGNKFIRSAPVTLLRRHEQQYLEWQEQQVVLLSQVLASDLTVGYTDIYDVVLTAFNGTKPRNLAHAAELLEACREEYMRFEFEGGVRITLPTALAHARSPDILKANLIPHPKSIHFQGDAAAPSAST